MRRTIVFFTIFICSFIAAYSQTTPNPGVYGTPVDVAAMVPEIAKSNSGDVPTLSVSGRPIPEDVLRMMKPGDIYTENGIIRGTLNIQQSLKPTPGMDLAYAIPTSAIKLANPQVDVSSEHNINSVRFTLSNQSEFKITKIVCRVKIVQGDVLYSKNHTLSIDVGAFETIPTDQIVLINPVQLSSSKEKKQHGVRGDNEKVPEWTVDAEVVAVEGTMDVSYRPEENRNGSNTNSIADDKNKCIFRVSNQTDRIVRYCYVYLASISESWKSVGWFRVAPSKSVDIDFGDYAGKTLYVYAFDESGQYSWYDDTSEFTFCVDTEKGFQIANSFSCPCTELKQRKMKMREIRMQTGINEWPLIIKN